MCYIWQPEAPRNIRIRPLRLATAEVCTTFVEQIPIRRPRRPRKSAAALSYDECGASGRGDLKNAFKLLMLVFICRAASRFAKGTGVCGVNGYITNRA